jgi:signal transduction histidine kinase
MKFYQFAKQIIKGSNNETEENPCISKSELVTSIQLRECQQANLTLRLSGICGWEYDVTTDQLSTIPAQISHNNENATGFLLLEELYTSPFRQEQDSIRKKMKLALLRGVPFAQEIKKLNAEGKESWIRFVCQVEQRAGKTTKLSGYFQDITEMKTNEMRRLNNKLRVSQQLLNRALWQQENELGRIAVDLHENIAQALIVARNYLKTDRSIIPNENNKHDRGINIIEQAITQIKELYEKIEVPPLHLLGLQGALSEIIEKYNQITPTRFILSEYNEEIEDADDLVKQTLIRITKELINNICVHAQAAEAWVSLELIDRGIVLSVKDDGIGFYPDKKQWRGGLNRAEILAAQLKGRIQLQATPGKGCEILIALPWSRKDRFQK